MILVIFQQSTKTVATPPPQQGSNLTAALAGGLTVLIGGTVCVSHEAEHVHAPVHVL
jgi:hypothetical protein